MIGFNKIVIVSLCDSWTKELSNVLSQSLDMIFCDTKDLIEYELIDKNALAEISSKEYMDEAERKVVKHIAGFENVVVGINYNYLSRHFDLLKNNSLVIYLSLSKAFVKANANPIDFVAYDRRNEELKNMADIVITVKKTEYNFVCLKIIDKLGEVYETCK